ncbi:MAG: SGNH/GDSL hydrolase family protein [Terracoccus sp.]
MDVIGDSLSTGYTTPGVPWTANAQQLFDARGQTVQIVNAASNGAGYVALGENDAVFLDQVDQIVTARSQVVLVFGSDNDLGQPGITPAITTTLNRIKSLAPNAQLIVVGPPAPPADTPAQLTGIRDALRAATRHLRRSAVTGLVPG